MFLSSQENLNKLMHERHIAITIEPSHSIPNLTIITMKGYFDLSTSKYVDEKVLPLMETGESNFILDLSDLDYLSSIGMMSLTKYQSLLMQKKRFLKLIRPPKPIYDTMTFFGFTKRFSIYDSVVEAVSSSR
jgi:anti-anti-sigma factor